jgi:ribosomal protein S4
MSALSEHMARYQESRAKWDAAVEKVRYTRARFDRLRQTLKAYQYGSGEKIAGAREQLDAALAELEALKAEYGPDGQGLSSLVAEAQREVEKAAALAALAVEEELLVRKRAVVEAYKPLK